MKKPKHPKPKLRKQPTPPRTLRHTPNEQQTGNRRSVAERIQNHSLIVVMTLVATVLAIGEPFYEALKTPEVFKPEYSPADPFLLDFKIRNPSWLFPMQKIRLNCVISQAKFIAGFNLKNVGATYLDQYILAPHEPLEYSCPIRKFLGLGPAETVTLRIVGQFSTLGWKRTFASEVFNWSAATNNWTEGQTVD